MATKKTYTCDLCDRDFDSHSSAYIGLIGVRFVERGWVAVAIEGAETHLCRKCIETIRALPDNIATGREPAVAAAGAGGVRGLE